MTKRNLYLVIFAGLAPFAAPAVANAADYFAQQQSYYAPYNWSGAYLGAHLGATADGFPNPFSSKSGVQFGAQVGTNFQSGMFVYGAELDGGYSTGAKHRLGGGAEFERTWEGAAKVKAGVAMDRTLIYGTAGYGMAKFKSKGTVISDDKWEGGYLLGAGVEQAVNDKLSAKLEYNYVDYGDVNSVVAGGDRRSDELSSHGLKLGLNYRF